MNSRSRLTALILLITLAWAGTLLIEGVPVSSGWLRSFSIVQIMVTGGIVIFDRLLWRIWLVPRLLGRPVIHGTWRGHVFSNYRDAPIPSYLAIKQTYSRISISLITDQGRSHSLACRWSKADNGEQGVFYIYQLVPDILSRKSDPVRFGGGMLEVAGQPPHEVHGPYWTDGLTVGKISFSEWTRKVCGDFRGAERADYVERMA